MSFKLFIQATVKFAVGALITGLLIFLPAGGLDYPNGWLFMGLLFIPMFIGGVVLMLKNPELLKKRLNVREKEGEQKTVVLLSGIMFIAGFVLCGLNYRFGWIVLPKSVVIAASVVFVLAYLRTCFTRRCCGRTLIFREQSRFKRGRRSLTPACTVWSVTQCTPPR